MNDLKKLDKAFYNRSDVVALARELIGKVLVTSFDNQRTSGRIVETEAYAGVVDRASHAFGGRRTRRTEIMYREGGTAYVYLCYGIHHLFNVVTNLENIPHAILIRALEPIEGVEWMLQRSRKKKEDASLTRGPGNLSRAMGLKTAHSGFSLTDGKEIYIGEDDFKIEPGEIITTRRIGVDYAAEDALLPYRFLVRGNQYVSGTPAANEDVLRNLS